MVNVTLWYTHEWKRTGGHISNRSVSIMFPAVFLYPSLFEMKSGVQGSDGKQALLKQWWDDVCTFQENLVRHDDTISLWLTFSATLLLTTIQNRSDISNSDLITQRSGIMWRPVCLEILQFRSVYSLCPIPIDSFSTELRQDEIYSHYFCHQFFSPINRWNHKRQWHYLDFPAASFCILDSTDTNYTQWNNEIF